MDWADVIYGVVTALVVGLGFILEIRRQRSEDRRTDPHTSERLARIEAQEPVRDAMERIAKLESECEQLNDRLAAFDEQVQQALASAIADVPRRTRSKPARR